MESSCRAVADVRKSAASGGRSPVGNTRVLMILNVIAVPSLILTAFYIASIEHRRISLPFCRRRRLGKGQQALMVDQTGKAFVRVAWAFFRKL